MTNKLAFERVAHPEANECIIWMHGLGADGHDFMPLVPELKRFRSTFIFPHAPMRPVTINNRAVMRAWYDIYSLDCMQKEDEAGLMASRNQIHALIASMESEGFKSTDIVLAGFSQGGVMALLAGLSYERPLKAIIALSCYLPLAAQWPGLGNPANQTTPIFMAHGNWDEMLPCTLAKQHATQLTQLGYHVAWHEYPMGHSVCADEVADIRKFL